ncbi:ABC transporter permease [bacterium SCGC AG-212-C10]|nr:ABC transporter permease [bacterium SCGC AG-212-C10]
MSQAVTIDTVRFEEAPVRQPNRLSAFTRRLLRDPVGAVAGAILILIVLGCLTAPLWTPGDPLVGKISERLQPVGTSGHILGTDEQGRDMLGRLAYGGRNSLLAGILPVLFGGMIGAVLGIIAGHFGGIVNTIIMRTMDIFYAFPAVLLAIGIAAALGAGLMNLVISISVVLIPPVARVAESAVRQIETRPFIEAARASGANSFQIILRQVVGNVFAPIFVYMSTLIGLSIVYASGLSYLGLGISQPTPEWGAMLNSLKDSIYTNPGLVAVPGMMIFIVSMCFNLVSDTIREAMDSKL